MTLGNSCLAGAGDSDSPRHLEKNAYPDISVKLNDPSIRTVLSESPLEGISYEPPLP